jgi:hypothetical protein
VADGEGRADPLGRVPPASCHGRTSVRSATNKVHDQGGEPCLFGGQRFGDSYNLGSTIGRGQVADVWPPLPAPTTAMLAGPVMQPP